VSDSNRAVMSAVLARADEPRREEVRSEPLSDLLRFSSLYKILSITSKVFRFIFLLRRSREDPALANRRYWVMEAQSTFLDEREYLLLTPNSRPPKPPGCVAYLNLFIDEDRFLRSKRRISMTVYFYYNVKNSLPLPKGHDFTRLVVTGAHAQYKHLGVP
jgi:hypothetical protein